VAGVLLDADADAVVAADALGALLDDAESDPAGFGFWGWFDDPPHAANAPATATMTRGINLRMAVTSRANAIGNQVFRSLAHGLHSNRDMQTTTTAKNPLDAQMRNVLDELGRLRDEIRVQIHLAGMDLKKAWDELEPKLAEADRGAENMTEEAFRTAVESLRKAKLFHSSLPKTAKNQA
jgi:hypothetical protein